MVTSTISTLAGLQALSLLSSLDALHAPDTARASTLSAHAVDSGAHAVLTPLDTDTFKFVSSPACAHSASAADAIGTAGTRSLGALAVDAALSPASVGTLLLNKIFLLLSLPQCNDGKQAKSMGTESAGDNSNSYPQALRVVATANR